MFDNFVIREDDDIISEDRREHERHLWEYGLSVEETTSNQDDLNDDVRSDSIQIEDEDDEEDKTLLREQFFSF